MIGLLGLVYFLLNFFSLDLHNCLLWALLVGYYKALVEKIAADGGVVFESSFKSIGQGLDNEAGLLLLLEGLWQGKALSWAFLA